MSLLTYRFSLFDITFLSRLRAVHAIRSALHLHLSARPSVSRAKVDFFDTGQKGFMLEVRSSGGKTYYQRYVDPHGRQRQFKIGSADTSVA